MAQASKPPEQANPVPNYGDHDRVQMLSLQADGTPDQHNPEVIGDRGTAVRAAQEQFAQQAVSAVDVAEHTGPVTLIGQEDGSVQEVPAHTGQDPAIEDAKAKHDKAAETAKKAAEKVVDSLHKG